MTVYPDWHDPDDEPRYFHKYEPGLPGYPNLCKAEMMYQSDLEASVCGGTLQHRWHRALVHCGSCQDRGMYFQDGSTHVVPKYCPVCELGAEMREFL